MKKSRLWDVVAVCVIAFLAVWIGLNCKYGTSNARDEIFYLVIPDRILSGDGLMTDEWQVSQLSSVLLLPLVWLWRVTHETNEGMYLAFAYAFAASQGLFCGTVYFLLRKYKYAALAAVACLSHFYVMNFAALGYNTVGLQFTVLLMCLLFRMASAPKPYAAVVCGALYAALVLCNIYSVFLFPVYVAAFAVFFVLHIMKKKTAPFYLLSLRGFLLFVAGILPVFLYFIAILLKNSTVGEIVKCIPYILSDPEHSVQADGSGFDAFDSADYLGALTDNIGVAPFILALIAVAGAILLHYMKKRRAAFFVLTGSSVLLFAAVMVHYLSLRYETDDPCLLFFIFWLEGFALYFLNGRRQKALFYTFICGGFLYSFFMSLASNLGYHTQTNGYAAALPGTILLLAEYYASVREDYRSDKPSRVALKSCCAILLSLVFFTNILYVFGLHSGVTNAGRTGSGIMECKYGVFKGKYLTNEYGSNYTYLYSDINALDGLAEEGDRLLVFNNFPAAYLETNKMKTGAMSAWLYTEYSLMYESSRERFFEYYRMFPENAPDFIYVSSFYFDSDGMKSDYAGKLFDRYITPFFEGERIDLNHGVALRVEGIKYFDR